jgi:hypothetical protein
VIIGGGLLLTETGLVSGDVRIADGLIVEIGVGLKALRDSRLTVPGSVPASSTSIRICVSRARSGRKTWRRGGRQPRPAGSRRW